MNKSASYKFESVYLFMKLRNVSKKRCLKDKWNFYIFQLLMVHFFPASNLRHVYESKGDDIYNFKDVIRGLATRK